eukprot:CAMPEP_0173436906 /NCGR_PEP_ID=MMETSP1357-20121228/17553_1 /TAXON_ID=77926 /ORGANISM="Hemiselmis rufescens, Strain PCC563" /LENGTH=75 /DNA_ID=CAMNT_0014402057 /DNA_START=78 /DNA_END=302 /DNA_ORIENTATION=-
MKGEMCPVELSSAESKVGELREKAAAALGCADGSMVLTLIFKGTVLKDDAALLTAAGFVEGDFVVCLTKKVCPSP